MLGSGMHGYNPGSAPLANAEVDSMGGVVDGGVGIGLKISPRRASIEKTQTELREEYDVHEERRRELEFLQKGGNPLDLKFGNAASVSVQSTSLTDQHHEQFVTSEPKGSFALTASPHGDSVDSSARPGPPLASEPITADNLLLLDAENELPESEKRCLRSNRRNSIAPSEQSSRIDGSQNTKETEDSAIFRPYARRNRSRTNHGPRGASREGKGLMSDTFIQKDHIVPSFTKPKSTSSNGDTVTKNLKANTTLNNELVGVQDHQSTSGSVSVPKDKLDTTLNGNLRENHGTLPPQADNVQNPVLMASGEDNVVEVREPVAAVDYEPAPTKPENGTYYGQPNGFGNVEVDRKSAPNGSQNSITTLGKNIDLQPCTQTSLDRDVNKDSDTCTNSKNVDDTGNTLEQTLAFENKLNYAGLEVMKARNKIKSENGATVSNEHDAGYSNHSGNGNIVKAAEDVYINSAFMSNIKGLHHNNNTISKADKDTDHPNSVKETNCEGHQIPVDVSISEPPQIAPPTEKVSTATSDYQSCSTHHMKLAEKAREDSILEEARIIEAKRKRIAALSIRSLPARNYIKSHWGFVLEEMSWLANDFAQERLWKITAAAQLGHRVALTCRLRVEKLNKHLGVKTLSHRISKAVMQFWHSAELLLDNDDPGINSIVGCVDSAKVDANEASRDQKGNSYVDTSNFSEGLNPIKHSGLKVHAYALRFLKASRSQGISSQAEAPTTPEMIFDSGIVDISWEEHLTEESLFYEVPPTAMEKYRISVESHFLQFEKNGSAIQGETSVYNTAAEFGSEEIAYDEEEGESNTYYLPSVYESVHKKHKNWKSYTPGSGDAGTDFPYVHYSTGTKPSMLFGKRPASSNVGSVPTKRMRTATRHRVVSPFTVTTGTIQAQDKADASSGDNISFHDDQSTLHVGPLIQKSMEVESVTDFEKQLAYDCAETSIKTKKKKKAMTLGSAYEQGWKLESSVQNEQRDHSNKRLNSHHFESNGSCGLYGQHNGKKPKITKQSLDHALDNNSPMTNSVPSPAASQMSNMSNPNKFIKNISGRDRGRKAKALKISAGQHGSGSPWSLFEDQALVVLVHDMGPNWELVSDAINSTLQIKCIFRKSNECKERHKILMDGSAGDGADSAEDSGSSQSYPSTLPGIPKGSARQLFQRLQGPMEEDTLKSHFEKIIKIGQKQHYLRNQIDNQDLKHLVPIHNSHVIALSQVCPNNLSGGILTPLDLCDSNTSNPDATALGYHGPHTGSLASSNQGSVPSVLPTSGLNTSLPGSSGMVLNNNFSPSSGPTAASVRYGVPRSSPLSVDEQQRLQQYNQMLSGRNIQQSSMSVPGTLPGNDHGVCMMPGGGGMGIMGGINRSMTMSRPGFQGMSSPSMLNSGSMLSSSINMHSGVGSGQGNSMSRPHDAPMRPGHNPEHQRQMVAPQHQTQVTQGNNKSNPALCGISSALNNQTTPPPVQPYPGHAQQQPHRSNPRPPFQGPSHAPNSQQQAYAVRLAKERQLLQQQRYLQQQQIAASNALMPHVQAQSQLPISSSPLQTSSQVQPPNSSQHVPLSPATPPSALTPMSSQHQLHKLHQVQHGLSRNPVASGLTNQAGKQRQRQPSQQQQQQQQQSGRQHPNQRHNVPPQQQAKLLKGIGRGNMLVRQNLSADPSHLNGLSLPAGSQTGEKGDQIMHMIQGQSFYPGSVLNPNQPSKPSGHAHSLNHLQLQQKLRSGSPTTSPKQLQISSDSSDQVQVSPVSSGQMLSPTQPAVIVSNHHQLQLQSNKINQTQSNIQRMLPQNCQVHSESSSKSHSDPTQVDQTPEISASQISTSSTMSQGYMDSSSVVPAVTTVSSQWKTSETPYDSNIDNQAPKVSSLGSAPVGNEQPTVSQGIDPRLVCSTSNAHNNGAQRQQQQPQPLQQSSQEQHKQQQQQQEHELHSPTSLASQHQSQQHLEHPQSGQSRMMHSIGLSSQVYLVLSRWESLCPYSSSVQMKLVVHGGLSNIDTDVRCFCTGPVRILTKVILTRHHCFFVLVLQILYIITLRRLPPFFWKEANIEAFVQGSLFFPFPPSLTSHVQRNTFCSTRLVNVLLPSR